MRSGGNLLIAIVAVFSACSSSDAVVADGPFAVDAAADAPSAVDAGLDAAVSVSDCIQARDAWRARFALVDRTCTHDSDCSLTPRGDGQITCNGTPTIGQSCEGEAARTTALTPAAAELGALQVAWKTACGNSCSEPGNQCYYDCGPGHAECLVGHCITRSNPCPDNCLCFEFPDGGI
jgi:hypothetical protein